MSRLDMSPSNHSFPSDRRFGRRKKKQNASLMIFLLFLILHKVLVTSVLINLLKVAKGTTQGDRQSESVGRES
ncbi:hypothetical protein CR513_41484, partial [Mucuna pruriens]